MADSYDDIIHLPHHTSSVHHPMTMSQRAAQFAPFAALTGHDEAIEESARWTDSQRWLDEGGKELIDQRLSLLMQITDNRPAADFTIFIPDTRKEGGSYTTIHGVIAKIDTEKQTITLTDGQKIDLNYLIDLAY